MIQPQRRIPFARREQLELEELLIELEADVIERVEGPTNWVSNIVITPKSDPSNIRMNVDMTAVNKDIKGELQRQNKLISSERPFKILQN